MISYDEIAKIVDSNLDVSYKLLTISKFKVNNEYRIQVHCDKHDCLFSHLYPRSKIKAAVSKFMEIKANYILSELKDKEKLEQLYGVS